MATPTDVKTEKNKGGRPLEYTKKMGDLICELTSSSGHGLLKLTRLYPELPDKITINRWRHRLPEFRTQYAMAKVEQADILAEEILEIADDDGGDIRFDKDGNPVCDGEFIARSRLRVDTRKWMASKLLPRQYGQNSDDAKSSSDSLVEKLIDKLVD
jgi:hypothetical protein